MAYDKNDYRSSSQQRNMKGRSKRQERVGQVVRTELSRIFAGTVVLGTDYIEEDLRRRISVVSVDVSPDLRQARVIVSVVALNQRNRSDSFVTADNQILWNDNDDENRSEVDTLEEEEEEEYYEEEEEEEVQYSSNSAIMEKRRAYSWIVKSTKSIRHAMALNLSHMKSVPELTFVHVDVGAAVDVMNLIDRVSREDSYKRESLAGSKFLLFTEGANDEEDDDWVDEDDDGWVDEMDNNDDDSENNKLPNHEADTK